MDGKRSVADQGAQKPKEKENLTSNDETKVNLADMSKLGKSSPVEIEKKSPISKGASVAGDKAQVKSVEYQFWHEDDSPRPIAININNWASVLRNGRHKEILNIWMRQDVPSITVRPHADHVSGGQVPSRQSEGEGVQVPSVTRPFLTWPVVDEFGEPDPLDLDDRCERFLRAFILDLPVPVTMSREERARRPKQASRQRVAAKTSISIPGKTVAQVRSKINADGDNAFAIELFDKFNELFGLFLPASYGTNFVSDPVRLYWGAVSVITV